MNTPRCLLLLGLVPLARAQDPVAIAPSALPDQIPIHAGAADPGAGRYGLWAAGPGYKASFHDGFAFYPFIPGQQEPRALHWRTESIELAGQVHPAAAPATTHTDWRCTLRRRGFAEIYDVRRDGVEQSFVIDQSPGAGDIVVTGTIATPFVAAPVLMAVGAITFRDEQAREVVTYGAAFAIDARGQRLALATSFDGERLRLRVPAEFVARAAFPLTIDPLSSVSIVSLSSAQPVRGTSAAATSAAGDPVSLLAVVREFAATDYDVVAYRMEGSTLTTLLADITTSWSSSDVDVGEHGADDAWLIAMERTFGGVSNGRGYVQRQSNRILNGGLFLALGPNLGADCRHPRVSGRLGSASGSVLFVYNDERSSATDPYGIAYSVPSSTLGNPFSLRGAAARLGNSRDLCVQEAASGSEPWRVAWVEDASSTDAVLRVAVVSTTGAVPAVRALRSLPNLRTPRLAGTAGRYLVTYLATDTASGNTQLMARRFDMLASGATSSVYDRVIASVASGLGVLLFNGDLSYDAMTRSHWALTYHRRTALLPGSTSAFAVRLGYTGGVVESASIHPSTAEGVANTAVAWNGYPALGEASKFLLTFSTTTPSQPAYFRTLEYAVSNGAFYGVSCRNNTYADGHPPYAGSEFYYTGVHGLPVGTPAVAFLGFAPADLPLDFIGMAGCRMLVDSVLSLSATAESTGYARITLPLPDSPLFQGSLFLQWAWFAAGANALGLVNGVGIRIEVR